MKLKSLHFAVNNTFDNRDNSFVIENSWMLKGNLSDIFIIGICILSSKAGSEMDNS